MKALQKIQWIAVITAALVLGACAQESPAPDLQQQAPDLQQAGLSNENANEIADAWKDCEISEPEQVKLSDVLESDWGNFEWKLLVSSYADIILFKELELMWEAEQVSFMVAKCKDDHDTFLKLIEEAKSLGDFFFEHAESYDQLSKETQNSFEERVKRFEIDMFGSEMVL